MLPVSVPQKVGHRKDFPLTCFFVHASKNSRLDYLVGSHIERNNLRIQRFATAATMTRCLLAVCSKTICHRFPMFIITNQTMCRLNQHLTQQLVARLNQTARRCLSGTRIIARTHCTKMSQLLARTETIKMSYQCSKCDGRVLLKTWYFLSSRHVFSFRYTIWPE